MGVGRGSMFPITLHFFQVKPLHSTMNFKIFFGFFSFCLSYSKIRWASRQQNNWGMTHELWDALGKTSFYNINMWHKIPSMNQSPKPRSEEPPPRAPLLKLLPRVSGFPGNSQMRTQTNLITYVSFTQRSNYWERQRNKNWTERSRKINIEITENILWLRRLFEESFWGLTSLGRCRVRKLPWGLSHVTAYLINALQMKVPTCFP